MVVYLHARNFFVSATNSLSAANPDCPTAVTKRGLILEACADAEKSGVTVGIRVALARRRCPDLRLVEFNPDNFAEACHALWSQFAGITPQVEPLDERSGYLSLAGCIPKGRSVDEVMTHCVLACYDKFGLLLDWGGGQDRWIAKLTCGENQWISAELEASVLKRMPLERLGMESRFCERLRYYGIKTVAELQATPRVFIASHLQVPYKYIEACLLRGDSTVRELFPPKEIHVSNHLDGNIEGEIERALLDLTSRAEIELKIGSRQCGQIALTIKDGFGRRTRMLKLAKPLAVQAGIMAVATTMLRELSPTDLRTIDICLADLTYQVSEQNDLWKRTNNLTAAPLAQAAQNLKQKYGTATLQTGNELAEQTIPRFAQLICRERGMFLP